MRRRITRRTVLQSAAASFGLAIVPAHVLGGGAGTPPSEKLNIAGIGVGGRGGGVLKEMSGHKAANIVALCDIDSKKAAGQFKTYAKAQVFKDYRQMLDKIGKDIDAIMCATPDHLHAPISLHYMRAGKHVYVEKPMAHSVEEARLMAAVAKEKNLVTQMGNNGHAGEGLRQTKEWLDAGAIGTVKEIHGWSDRPGVPDKGKKQWWPQPAVPAPKEKVAPPAELDWDLFLGPAPERPYDPAIHSFKWRGYFDFGTGALGDMAVHNIDPAFFSLDLGAPLAASVESSPIGHDSYPAWQICTWEFAARGARPALKLKWYDGGKKPQAPAQLEGYDIGENGILFVGDKGVIACGGWSGNPRLFPGERRKEFKTPEKTLPRSNGHQAEWIDACLAGKPEKAMAGFWYSGPFTEALLVGVIACRLQKRVEWDSAAMKCPNAPEADPIIRKVYRKGFDIRG
ncbi:MAG: Gfo/Idh/MocA family protein [Phycisphaerae bacterium]